MQHTRMTTDWTAIDSPISAFITCQHTTYETQSLLRVISFVRQILINDILSTFQARISVGP